LSNNHPHNILASPNEQKTYFFAPKKVFLPTQNTCQKVLDKFLLPV